MAALLFLTIGSQEKAELSRRELLESCEAVVNASPEVIEGAKKRLKDVRPENADQIEALLSQPRSIQLLQDLTLGSQTVVGRSDMDLVYEALRESVAEEERTKAKWHLPLSPVTQDLVWDRLASCAAASGADHTLAGRGGERFIDRVAWFGAGRRVASGCLKKTCPARRISRCQMR
jgi:hypothetical protein